MWTRVIGGVPAAHVMQRCACGAAQHRGMVLLRNRYDDGDFVDYVNGDVVAGGCVVFVDYVNGDVVAGDYVVFVDYVNAMLFDGSYIVSSASLKGCQSVPIFQRFSPSDATPTYVEDMELSR